MTEIKTTYTAETLLDAYRKKRREAAWIRRLLKNGDALNEIGDIVKLDSLWDYGYQSLSSPQFRTLYLRYCGKATTEEEFKADSIRIMRALKCIFGDPEMHNTYHASSPPSNHYRAVGRVGKLRVHVDLVVPWLPKGCEVRVERHRHQTSSATYSVSCRR